MIIVSGRIFVKSGARDQFPTASAKPMAAARIAPGCIDFVVAPDPIDAERVNIYEEWEAESQLQQFREGGPSDDLSALIARAEVKQRVVEDNPKQPKPAATRL